MAAPAEPTSRGSLFPSEAELEHLVVGPGSVSWEYGSDPRLYLAMLAPLLLQVAHPVVGAGVSDYSSFEARPWARLVATLDYVTLLIYGGREAAVAGRRLRDLHKRFRGVRPDGRPYHALEPSAYAWVHATLIDAYVSGHRHFGRPMNAVQCERFLREYRGLGRLIGVRESDLPDDWHAFRRYFDTMIDRELELTQSVLTVLATISDVRQPPLPLPLPEVIWRGLRLPASRALWLGGVGLLPERLRERLAIRWSARDEVEFRMLGTASRALTPLMPERLRVTGPAQLRMRHDQIEQGPLGGGG